MSTHAPTLVNLFEQLGLPADQASINQFVKLHSPLDDACRLADAPFWDSAQADLLREKLLQDSEWAQAVDELNLLLRD